MSLLCHCFVSADDGSGPDRMCSLMGPADRVGPAALMIQDLVESALVSLTTLPTLIISKYARSRAFLSLLISRCRNCAKVISRCSHLKIMASVPLFAKACLGTS